MMPFLRASAALPSIRLTLLAVVLLADLLATAGGLFLSEDVAARQDHVERMRRELNRLEQARAAGQADQEQAEKTRRRVTPLVLADGGDGLPPRLQLLHAIDARRLARHMPPLRYRLAAENVEAVPGSGLEQVSRPFELEMQAPDQAGLAAFWQDLQDGGLPGLILLDGATIEKTPGDKNAAGVTGHIRLRQLSLRPAGSGADVP